MMFYRTLTEVDSIFTNNLHSEFSDEEWREKQHTFLHLFDEDIKPLLDLCHKEPFSNILVEAKSEQIIWPSNGIRINEYRIRPKNDYFTTLKKPIPQPDNPSGPSATGVELSVGVCRGISKDKVYYPPFVGIKFDIWGHEERKNFISFFKNYKRPIGILLGNLNLELFTACYFENLKNYSGNDIIKQLELYLSNRIDPEACFSIGKSFNKNADTDKITIVFRNLMILYHCCFGYCKKEKEPDRLLNFCNFIQSKNHESNV